MLSYAECQRLMRSARAPERGKPLQNNTRLYERHGAHAPGGTYYAVCLHATDVVEIYANGTYGVRHGGWTTNVTRDRIYSYSPLSWHRLESVDGDWYLRVRPSSNDPEPPGGGHAHIGVVQPYPQPSGPLVQGPELQWDYHVREVRRRYARWFELVEHYGSYEAWRAAWRDDRQRVVQANRLWRAWNERNRIPFDGLVRLNAQGYPLWSEVRWARARAAINRRAAIRLRQEEERRAREAAALERFKASIRRRRKPTFEQRAAEVARELAAISDGLKVSVSINDSQE